MGAEGHGHVAIYGHGPVTLILTKLANKLTLAPLLSKDNFNNLLPLYYDLDNAIKIVTNSILSTKVV